jgi:hypothetical protein
VDAIDETARPPLKIWLDTGTREEGWERARELRDRLVLKGWRLYDDLQYLEADGSDHSEGAWAARMDPVLRFLFPPLPPGIATPRPPRFAAVREKLRSLSNGAKRLTKVR